MLSHDSSEHEVTRRSRVLGAASDTGMNFAYYDRKEDKELPVGEIEEAIKSGEVSVKEIGELFLNGAGLTNLQF